MSGGWEDARLAATQANVEVRRLKSLEGADEAMRVMRATWGENQEVPRELLRAFEASDNLLHGAYRNGELVGFALGFWGRDDDGFNLHSHMLAVMPDARTAGVGYALKFAQRASVLAAGVSRIRWTFDPLVSRNAHFNLSKLGAVADGFERNFYGSMDDHLNSGDRSDRLVVRWDVGGTAILPDEAAEELAARAETVLNFKGDPERPAPGTVRSPRSGPALVRIPAEYEELRSQDPEAAAAWRDAAAEALEACFAAGLVAGSFSREFGYLFT